MRRTPPAPRFACHSWLPAAPLPRLDVPNEDPVDECRHYKCVERFLSMQDVEPLSRNQRLQPPPFGAHRRVTILSVACVYRNVCVRPPQPHRRASALACDPKCATCSAARTVVLSQRVGLRSATSDIHTHTFSGGLQVHANLMCASRHKCPKRRTHKHLKTDKGGACVRIPNSAYASMISSGNRLRQYKPRNKQTMLLLACERTSV